VLSGHVEAAAQGRQPAAVCTECKDDRKDKPMVGLRSSAAPRRPRARTCGRRQDPRPRKRQDYTLRLTPIDGGKKLEVRGSIGPFGRTQTWMRVQ
jgi:uncharacterized protein (DUF2147 family)